MPKSYMGTIGICQHNQFVAFKRILSNHGIYKNIDVADILGISPQAYQYKIRDEILRLTCSELRKIALTLDFSSSEISEIVKG